MISESFFQISENSWLQDRGSFNIYTKIQKGASYWAAIFLKGQSFRHNYLAL